MITKRSETRGCHCIALCSQQLSERFGSKALPARVDVIAASQEAVSPLICVLIPRRWSLSLDAVAEAGSDIETPEVVAESAVFAAEEVGGNVTTFGGFARVVCDAIAAGTVVVVGAAAVLGEAVEVAWATITEPGIFI